MGEIANGVRLSVDPENDLETGKLIAEIEKIPPPDITVHQCTPHHCTTLNFTNLDVAKGSILDNDLKKAR